MQALPRGQHFGMLACRLEVVALDQEFAAEGAHGGVLLHGVALGDADHRANAVAPRGEGDRLPVIAPGRRDDAGNPGAPAC